MELTKQAYDFAQVLLKINPVPKDKPAKEEHVLEPAKPVDENLGKRNNKYSLDYEQFRKLDAAQQDAQPNPNQKSDKSQEQDAMNKYFAHTHDKRKQRELFQKPTKEKLDNAEFFKNQGNKCYSDGDMQNACLLYEKAVVHFDYTFPETPEETARMQTLKDKCYQNLGFAQHRVGNIDEAVYSLGQCLQANPRNIKALYRLALIALQKSEFEQSHKRISQIFEIDPSNQQTKGLQNKLVAKQRESRLKQKQLVQSMFS